MSRLRPFGTEWIFCTKCNFLLPLRQLIFRQKQPGHWGRGCLPFLPTSFNVFVWSSIVTFVFLGFALFSSYKGGLFLFERCSTFLMCAVKHRVQVGMLAFTVVHNASQHRGRSPYTFQSFFFLYQFSNS